MADFDRRGALAFLAASRCCGYVLLNVKAVQRREGDKKLASVFVMRGSDPLEPWLLMEAEGLVTDKAGRLTITAKGRAALEKLDDEAEAARAAEVAAEHVAPAVTASMFD